MKTWILLTLSLLTTTLLQAQQPSHLPFSQQLQQFVSEKGTVNYADWKKEEGKLDLYLNSLAKDPPQTDWSQNEKLAYWINAYNAFTIKLILKNHPLKSIRDLHKGDPWQVKWIELGGQSYSLNQIEHEIIRPQFGDPRIHFALNCAAASCPPILNEAFLPEKLETQLEAQTRKFINNPEFHRLSGQTFQTSQLFNWYAEDFGDPIQFINRYRKPKLPSNTRITFLEYDWALNGK